MDNIQLINLEQGLPFVNQAIKRLTYELKTAQFRKTPVLKLIHGYGSSGTGGKIRIEVRKYLLSCIRTGLIEDFIEGEKFDIFESKTQKALSKYPCLSKDKDLQRSNNGITIVLVKIK